MRARELDLGEIKLSRHLRANRISKRKSEQSGRIDPTRTLAYLEGRSLVACYEIGQQTDGQAATEHAAVSGADDPYGKCAQLAEPVEEIKGRARGCCQRCWGGLLSVHIAARAEVVASPLQHHALDGVAFLSCEPLDCCLHVARHLRAERIEVRRVI